MHPARSYVLSGEGRSAFLGDYLTHPDHLDPLILSHVRNDSKITRAQQLEGYDKIAALRPEMDAIASRFHALVTPSTVDEAVKLVEPDRFTGDASFNLMWTILQVPVLNVRPTLPLPARSRACTQLGTDSRSRSQVPGFAGPSGCPLGLSLVAPRYHDQRLLWVGEAVGRVWGEKGGWKSAL